MNPGAGRRDNNVQNPSLKPIGRFVFKNNISLHPTIVQNYYMKFIETPLVEIILMGD